MTKDFERTLKEPCAASLPSVDFEDEYDDDDVACSICNGEGEFFGSEIPGYDPGWHLPDRVYPCPSCGGTGNRRDQRYM